MKYLARKIALVGCLGIDPVDIFSLAKNHWVEGLVLTGDGSEALADIVNRMLDRWGVPDQPRVRSVSMEQAANAAIAIMNPFTGPCIAESRLESVQRKASRLESDIRELRANGFNGKLLIVTEPVDVLTSTAVKASGLDAGSVIGMGTSEFDVPTAKRSTPNVWCTGMRGDAAFIDHCDPNCHHFEDVVSDAAKITPGAFKFSGNRVAGMALCVARICQAILNDEHEILPVSTWLSGQYGISGTAITVPCILGREGVERIVELPITSAERKRMERHASDVRDLFGKIKSERRRAYAASLSR